MKYRMFSLVIFFALHASCQARLEVSDVYRFAITHAIYNYYSKEAYPQPELDRVIVDEMSPGDEEFYKKLLNNAQYKRYKLSFEEIEKLRTRDRYEFTLKRKTTIKVSDELFYSNRGEYIIYYQLNAPGGGDFYRLHFKKSDDRFEVIENVEEAVYRE